MTAPPGPGPAGLPGVRILHVTSNGTGLGHLARQAAIALANNRGHPGASRLLSLSTAAPLLAGLGLATEYLPGFDRGFIPRARWDAYLADRIDAAITAHRPDVVMFDAVTPHQYPGVLMAASRHPRVRVVWCRRGFWRDRFAPILDWDGAFDAVVEPGDIAAEFDDGPTADRPALRVPPVSLLAEVDQLPRAQAAAALGVDPDRPALLVSLGSGTGAATAHALPAILRAAAADAQWQVLLTRAPIAAGGPPGLPAGVRVLSGVFPLVRYQSALDLAVTTAGYNAVHELLPGLVPTVLVGNPGVLTDDQDRRARALAMMGLAGYAGIDDAEGLSSAVARMLTGGGRSEVRAALEAARDGGRLPCDGSSATVAVLADLARGEGANRISGDSGWSKRAHRRSRVLGRVGPRAASWGMAAVGRTVRRSRPPVPGPAAPLAVAARALDVDPGPEPPAGRTGRPRRRAGRADHLLFGHASAPAVLQRGAIVEDVWADADEQYLAARRRIIERYYRPRWVDG